MKIRTGFVSNSSTSSFLIAYKRVGVCPTCGRSSDFISAVESFTAYDDDDTVLIMLSPDVAHQSVQNDIDSFDGDWPSDQVYKDQLKKTLVSIDKLKAEGYEFASFELSYHNEYLHKLMDEAVSNSSVVILTRYE